MAMKRSMGTVAILLFWLLTINVCFSLSLSGRNDTGCIKSERKTLLMFKKDLKDPSNRLALWAAGDQDCCKWPGVVCDSVTRHVRGLDLRNQIPPPSNVSFSVSETEAYNRSRLIGKLNPSLLSLKHLVYLDLSNNYFEGIQIPRFLGSMKSLRYLNLSNAGFEGVIPHELGNLSNLHYLNLGDYEGNLYAKNLQWLSGLSLLEHLDLSGVNASEASDWLQVINTLPSLEELHLSFCQLTHIPPLLGVNFSSLSVLDLSVNAFQGQLPDGLQNLTSLRELDLSGNTFSSSIPDWLFGFTHLVNLDLSYNNFELENGIPQSLGNLCNLRELRLSNIKLRQDMKDVLEILSRSCAAEQLVTLDLGGNQVFGHLTNQLGLLKNLETLVLCKNLISGLIPGSLLELLSLRVLRLDYNKLNGTLPAFVGQLANLEILAINNNFLEGIVSENHFVSLSKLEYFDASTNSLVLKVSPNWVPPFQLKKLLVSSFCLGPRFPQWLSSQISLTELDMSNSGISDTIPDWFWSSIQFQVLNLSHNQIHGQLSGLRKFVKYGLVIDLSSNLFKGELPPLSNDLFVLDLFNNSLSGSISPFLCQTVYEVKQLRVLNLGKNYFSGEIPDCWMQWPSLVALRLGNNNFTGHVPSSIGTLSFLKSFHLHNNHLSGELPLSLGNCTQLVMLDISENELVGSIPTFMGKGLSNLIILILRSNKFHGHIPEELCDLISLQILDLSSNDLYGSIPKCIGNFSAISALNSSPNYIKYCDVLSIFENAVLVMKGEMVGYSTILKLVTSIDLSHNTLSGDIPKELTSLHDLRSLDLSNNLLTGMITETIGVMQSLESLDFSANQLSGEIPQSTSNLTFLSHLNLSDNNLTGKIPSSTQLQGFSASSFIGNLDLCGAPLTKNCTEEKSQETTPAGKNGDDDSDTQHFYISMAVGFVVSFWGFCSSLLIKKNWRQAYFRFLDDMRDRIYLEMVLKVNWFREKLRKSRIGGA